MNIIRRQQNWLPDVFNDIFDNNWMVRPNATAPAINVLESDNEYGIEVAAPGMTKEDFNVHIDEDNNLVIAMQKKTEKTDKGEDKANARYLRREFSYTKFEQRMILPDNANKDAIEAKIENGVLQVSIPKLKEEELKKATRVIKVQ
jgi:HSP20 family protein